MHITNRINSYNWFIIYDKIFPYKEVFAYSFLVQLLDKLPKHKFVLIIWLVFVLNCNSSLPLTNK